MTVRLVFLLAFLHIWGYASSIVLASSPASPLPVKQSPSSLQKPVDDLLSRMSLEEKLGQLFIVAADGDIENHIRTYHLGGVVLFARHAATLDQTLQLTEKIYQSSNLIAPFIAVDQEGGRVSRLAFATPVPDARRLGSLPQSSLAQIGHIVGLELAALGFNLNFAPVLDVDTCAENPVIGNRAFSDDPYLVAQLGSAYIDGLHSARILAATKHFPGHGDTSLDSHLVLPTVSQSAETLQSRELLPFRAAIRSGVDLIMSAHVYYPSLEPKLNLPASLSKSILTDLLRHEMDYPGIIITDAMNMKAITNLADTGQAAKAAFIAGADIILMPPDLPTAYHALFSAVKTGEIPLSRVDASVRRILSAKFRFPVNSARSFEEKRKHALHIVGSSSHRLLMEKILNGKE